MMGITTFGVFARKYGMHVSQSVCRPSNVSVQTLLAQQPTYAVVYNLISRCVRWRDEIHVHFIIWQSLQ